MSGLNKHKVTIYTTTEFMGNVVRHEGYLLNHGRQDYAQYSQCPFVIFTPRGKRKEVRILKYYKPYLLIVDGWDHIEPPSLFEASGGCSKYASFDPRWRRDFDEVLAGGAVKMDIIADYRDQSHLQEIKEEEEACGTL